MVVVSLEKNAVSPAPLNDAVGTGSYRKLDRLPGGSLGVKGHTVVEGNVLPQGKGPTEIVLG